MEEYRPRGVNETHWAVLYGYCEPKEAKVSGCFLDIFLLKAVIIFFIEKGIHSLEFLLAVQKAPVLRPLCCTVLLQVRKVGFPIYPQRRSLPHQAGGQGSQFTVRTTNPL